MCPDAEVLDGRSRILLDIGGMTCASCAARIEKKLNRMVGVTASVNYATEKASVTFDGAVTTASLIAQVEATGYTAHLPQVAVPAGEPDEQSIEQRDEPTRLLRQRVVISAILAVPVIAMAMSAPGPSGSGGVGSGDPLTRISNNVSIS